MCRKRDTEEETSVPHFMGAWGLGLTQVHLPGFLRFLDPDDTKVWRPSGISLQQQFSFNLAQIEGYKGSVQGLGASDP